MAYVIHVTRAKRRLSAGKKVLSQPYARRMRICHVVQCPYRYYEMYLHKLEDHLLTNGAAIYCLLILPPGILILARVFWTTGLVRELQCLAASAVSCMWLEPCEVKAAHPMWYITCSAEAWV
jgi:hypothetical protein